MKGIFLKILTALACLAMTLGFIACGGDKGSNANQSLSVGESSEETQATVTYYANGGEFNNFNEVYKLYYGDDKIFSKLFYDGLEFHDIIEVERHQGDSRYPVNIGVDRVVNGYNLRIERENYEFTGWYHVAVDEETGELLANAETGECTLDMEKPVDFETLLEDGDEWHIGALWTKEMQVRVRLVSDDPITDKSGNVFDPNADEDIKVFNYVKYGPGIQTEMGVANFKSPINLPATPTKATHVFAGYYFDEECTQPVTAEIELQLNQKEDVVIYAKYLPKDWTVVWNSRTAQDMFYGMFQESKKYFVARDVVMSAGDTVDVTDFAAIVDGNGRTISGVTVNVTVPNGKDAALFGNIAATAEMKNLTFENVNVTYGIRGRGSANFYFVCLGIAEGAKFENVTMSGAMEVNDNAAINLEGGTKSCIFGGFATDAEYIEANPSGFKIKNMSLKYNTTEFVEVIKDFAIIN